MLTTESVRVFLESSTWPDLAELYDPEMEVQVNVARDNGEPVDGKKKVYTDGIQQWKSFRIPYKADSEPQYEDRQLNFDLGAHVEAVGMSGWNWKRGTSMWVGFDFDAIVGHSPTHGKKLSADHLNKIREAVEEVPYVTVRASTGGHGLHVYVFLAGVPTKTHTEHAALARAILDKLSFDCGYDLNSAVDVCGAILWVWHRKLNQSAGGLKLLKRGETLKEIPKNWRDHIVAVSGRKAKSKPAFVTDQTAEELFDTLSSHRHKVQLDDSHKALIRWLKDPEHKTYAEFNVEHNMLITHTAGLLDAFNALGFQGIFKTISEGTDRFDQNCFAFPMKNGAWVVRRFTRGTQEAETWERDDKGWTRCFLNKAPNFRLACISKGGIEVKEGGFLFEHTYDALKAVSALGMSIEVPARYQTRSAALKELKDGKLYMTMREDVGDNRIDLPDWLFEKDTWKKVLQKPFSQYEEVDSVDHDNVVRCLVSNGKAIGWALNTSNDVWIMHPDKNITIYLRSLGMDPNRIAQVMGSGVSKYWTIVNKPFQPEYPGDRQWNRDAAQLAVTPTLGNDNLNYPHWSKVLKHLGKGLDEPLSRDAWAQMNNITTGEEYLRLWIASVIKYPTQPLPYLFFFGKEDCGKSVFCESLELIIKNGIVKADSALMNPSNFNGELEHSVICYIEETDLSQPKSKSILNRLKDYVTANNILLHVKNLTPCMIPNTTHWVQFGNHMEYCPAFPGDSRIVVLNVEALDPLEMIPKRQLLDALHDEAPDFLRSILDLELPPTPSRLNIPVIKTVEKAILMEQNQSPTEMFLENNTFRIPGAVVDVEEFFQAFLATLDPIERNKYKKSDLIKILPMGQKVGKSTRHGARRVVSNTSLRANESPTEELFLVDGWLRTKSWLTKKGLDPANPGHASEEGDGYIL